MALNIHSIHTVRQPFHGNRKEVKQAQKDIHDELRRERDAKLRPDRTYLVHDIEGNPIIAARGENIEWNSKVRKRERRCAIPQSSNSGRATGRGKTLIEDCVAYASRIKWRYLGAGIAIVTMYSIAWFG